VTFSKRFSDDVAAKSLAVAGFYGESRRLESLISESFW